MNEQSTSNKAAHTAIPPPQGIEQARLQRSRAGQKGGERSARVQQRDSFGQFAGRTGEARPAMRDTVTNDQGPH